MGKSTINGIFSIAMLDYQRVPLFFFSVDVLLVKHEVYTNSANKLGHPRYDQTGMKNVTSNSQT